MNKLVSIIIVNYSKNLNDQLTLDCLKSLISQTYSNFEVILIDNGSSHEIFRKLKEDISQFSKLINIRLIRSERNLFFTGGNNKALKIARGDYICLLNNDTTVMTDFIYQMVEFLYSHPNAGFICPKIKTFINNRVIWYAGGLINLTTMELVRLRGQWEYDPYDQKYNSVIETDFAASTSVFFRRELIEKIGLMDDIFLMYHDDPDWNLRAQSMGMKSYYVPSTIVYHKVTKKIKQGRELFNNFFYVRNSQILVWKHASIIDLFVFYVKFGALNLKELITYIVLGSFPLKFLKFVTRSFIINQRNKKIYKYIAYIHFNAIKRGFIIGLRKKLHLSCRKNMVKDYHFIEKNEVSMRQITFENLHYL